VGIFSIAVAATVRL